VYRSFSHRFYANSLALASRCRRVKVCRCALFPNSSSLHPRVGKHSLPAFSFPGRFALPSMFVLDCWIAQTQGETPEPGDLARLEQLHPRSHVLFVPRPLGALCLAGLEALHLVSRRRSRAMHLHLRLVTQNAVVAREDSPTKTSGIHPELQSFMKLWEPSKIQIPTWVIELRKTSAVVSPFFCRKKETSPDQGENAP